MRIFPGFGGRPVRERLKRIKLSENYAGGVFQNPVETVLSFPFFKVMCKLWEKDSARTPGAPVPVLKPDPTFIESSCHGITVTWLGHSSYLLGIEGKTVLVDPVFSQRVSPFRRMGAKQFPFSETIGVEDLPRIDVVLLTHDHYDHLDFETICKLRDRVPEFIMPLGVGAHLEAWGIDAGKITELDWWEQTGLLSGLNIQAVPARHFSGRGLFNRFSTLWAAFVIQTPRYSLFCGGDSGYFSGFAEIGRRLGPFDLAILECGQYSSYWPAIHMSPEETVQASVDLGASVLLPVHWAKFRLSIHPWKEPVERLLAEAERQKVSVVTPRIGETFSLAGALPRTPWWNFE